MKCAKIVISLVLISRICSSAGGISNQLAITDGPSTKIQSCVAKVIEHILNPSESLVLVISAHPDYIPSRLPNPVTIVDMRMPLPIHYKRYEVNYVIEAENHSLFAQTFNTILGSPLWHPRESPKGKLVILIKEEEALQTIFFKIWRNIQVLHIIIVTYDDTSQNCPMKIVTSNPQAEGNNCAGKPTVFSNFSCDNISSLAFLKPIRDYNGCSVYIQPNPEVAEFDLNMKGHRIMYNLLVGLEHTLNVTTVFLFEDNDSFLEKLFEYKEIFMLADYFGKRRDMESSIIFSRRVFVWMGPRPNLISPLNTLFLPFNNDMWIAVLFITILFVLVKWMIIKGNGNNNNCANLASAFTDIIGLTFGVSVNSIPNIWSLKLLLGFFLVYLIHIHTAYTADLINILTVPRYEGLIRNVEEVGYSGLPIFIPKSMVTRYFQDVDGGSLLGKINKLIIPVCDFDGIWINVTKQFNVWDEDYVTIPDSEVRLNSRLLGKIKYNTFLTNDISGEIKQVFLLRNGSYFAESLNAVITHLWESGIYENLNPSDPNIKMKVSEAAAESAWNNFVEDKNDIIRPLRLKDLLPIFVILLVCLSFSTIVFVAEIFVHKIVAQHS